MSSFGEQLREHVAMFFTNWRNPDYTVPQKLRLTVKNRAMGLVHGGVAAITASRAADERRSGTSVEGPAGTTSITRTDDEDQDG